MEWISVCDEKYNPIHGHNYLVYMSDGGMILGAYNKYRKSFVEIRIGEEYSESNVTFISSLTNPWTELNTEEYDKSE